MTTRDYEWVDLWREEERLAKLERWNSLPEKEQQELLRAHKRWWAAKRRLWARQEREDKALARKHEKQHKALGPEPEVCK